jgi:hypothetical protein
MFRARHPFLQATRLGDIEWKTVHRTLACWNQWRNFPPPSWACSTHFIRISFAWTNQYSAVSFFFSLFYLFDAPPGISAQTMTDWRDLRTCTRQAMNVWTAVFNHHSRRVKTGSGTIIDFLALRSGMFKYYQHGEFVLLPGFRAKLSGMRDGRRLGLYATADTAIANCAFRKVYLKIISFELSLLCIGCVELCCAAFPATV